MEEKIDISVIVPIYNVEKYLKRCLDSLINQTKREIEIILIDDGSTDNCGKICDEYAKKDNRIVVIHKQNGGVSAARNDGIKVAKGEWIAFADSDDWAENNIYEEVYNEVRQNKDVDAILFNYFLNYDSLEEINKKAPKDDFITEDKEIIRKIQLSILYPTFAPYCKAFPFMGAPWNKLFKTEIVKNNNIEFPLEVKGIYDDALFCLKYYNYVKKLVFFNKHLYHYRRLSTSILNKFKANRLEINEKVFDKIEEFIEQGENKEDLKKAYYSRVILYLGCSLNIYFFNKDNPKTFKEKIKELKNVVNSKRYKEALKNADYNYLGKTDKIYCILLKKNMMLATYFIYKLKMKKENLKGRKKQ